jgi:hypothetical protein
MSNWLTAGNFVGSVVVVRSPNGVLERRDTLIATPSVDPDTDAGMFEAKP